MYERLTEEQIEQLKKIYDKNTLYQITRKGINDIALLYNDLRPEEIWQKAFDIIAALKKSSCRFNDVDNLKAELMLQFLLFKEDGDHEHRKPQDAERSAFMVLFAVLSLLVVANTDLSKNPYQDLMTRISIYIKDYPLCKQLFAAVRKKEIEFEKNGIKVPFIDPFGTTQEEIKDAFLQEAITISLNCKCYLNSKFANDYIEQTWKKLWNTPNLYLSRLLQSQSKVKVICGILGVMRTKNVFVKNGRSVTNKQLACCLYSAHTFSQDEATLEKYIGSGANPTKADRKQKTDVVRMLDKARQIVH